MPLIIRPYIDAIDRPAMIALYRAAWHATYDPVDGAAAIDRLIAALLEGDPPEMFVLPGIDTALVAIDGGHIIGGIRGHPRDGVVHLSGVYVHPHHQRSGAGSALLADLLLRCRPGSVIRADVRPTSLPAMTFYERHGFEPVGQGRTNSGGEHWVDTTMMQRTLK